MAKEQQIVVRDFLGLGPKAMKEKEMSLSLFPDAQSKPMCHSKVLSTSLGQGMLSAFSNQNGKRFLTSDFNNLDRVVGHHGGHLNGNNVIGNLALHGNNQATVIAGQAVGANHAGIQTSWLQVGTPLIVKEEAVEDGLNLNEGEKGTIAGAHPAYSLDSNYRHYVQERGIWHPWSKSAMMQQATHVERNIQVLPGNLALPDFRFSQAVDGGNINQAFGLHREHQNITSKNDCSSTSNEVEMKFTAHARQLGGPITQRSFRSIGPVAANSRGKSMNPQLTIFYAGTVNVFDDVPAEKAQTIMLLAGSSFPSSMKAGNSADLQSVSCMPTCTSLITPSSPLPHPVASSPSSRTQSPQKHPTMQVGVIVGIPLTSPPSKTSHNYGPGASKQEPFLPGTPSTPSTMPACLPTTLRALPQARKASLARFLEKRKERVCSKMPYSIKKDHLEPMLPQGEKAPADSDINESACGMEERVALIEDVASSEMEGEEHVGFKNADKQKHACETECSSISFIC